MGILQGRQLDEPSSFGWEIVGVGHKDHMGVINFYRRTLDDL